jgi:maltose O-acetyltransferase
VQRAIDERGPAVSRIAPGEEIGERPRGFAGWARRARRRIALRVRGEQDPSRLVRQGMRVGRDVLITRGCYFDPGFSWLISIGDETSLGPNVTILTHDATPKLRTGWSQIAPVRIGARVFIGANATILPGVVVGDDAIVGAGSVVRRDVAPGTVVAGNPAVEVGTTADHTSRHTAQLARRPRYPQLTGGGAGPRPDERRRILDELRDGPGYVG